MFFLIAVDVIQGILDILAAVSVFSGLQAWVAQALLGGHVLVVVGKVLFGAPNVKSKFREGIEGLLVVAVSIVAFIVIEDNEYYAPTWIGWAAAALAFYNLLPLWAFLLMKTAIFLAGIVQPMANLAKFLDAVSGIGIFAEDEGG